MEERSAKFPNSVGIVPERSFPSRLLDGSEKKGEQEKERKRQTNKLER